MSPVPALFSDRPDSEQLKQNQADENEYGEYIRNIVLQDMLETQLESLIDSYQATELQSMADNLVSNCIEAEFEVMNAEILALTDDLERISVLQESLEGIIPRIMSLTWVTSLSLNKIQQLLIQQTSTIPVINASYNKDTNLSSIVQCSRDVKDSETCNTVKALKDTLVLLETFQVLLSGARTDARDMHKILLDSISHTLCRITKDKMSKKR